MDYYDHLEAEQRSLEGFVQAQIEADLIYRSEPRTGGAPLWEEEEDLVAEHGGDVLAEFEDPEELTKKKPAEGGESVEEPETEGESVEEPETEAPEEEQPEAEEPAEEPKEQPEAEAPEEPVEEQPEECIPTEDNPCPPKKKPTDECEPTEDNPCVPPEDVKTGGGMIKEAVDSVYERKLADLRMRYFQ
jgi:outer membrane biosynthesis protein TonB